MDPEMIGRTVAEARKRQNYTQSELAEAAGVSRGTVCSIEAGKSVTTYNLVRVMDILSIDIMPRDVDASYALMAEYITEVMQATLSRMTPAARDCAVRTIRDALP